MSRLAPVLLNMDAICLAVAEADKLAVQGRQSEALERLRNIARFAAAERRQLAKCIAAQGEAAQALNLAQGREPRVVAIASLRPTAENPDPANSHSTNPSSPTA